MYHQHSTVNVYLFPSYIQPKPQHAQIKTNS